MGIQMVAGLAYGLQDHGDLSALYLGTYRVRAVQGEQAGGGPQLLLVLGSCGAGMR